MDMTTNERNVALAIIAVFVVLAIIGSILIGRGCGGREMTVVTVTVEPAETTPTQTPVDTTPSTQTVAQTVAAPPAPPKAQVIEQSIAPINAPRGARIVLYVMTRGDVASVKMELDGPAGFVLDLNKGPTSYDGTTTWNQMSTAPAATGDYKYNAIATSSDGTTIDGPSVPYRVLP